jgi:DNA-binding MarR family transcriptional regulator
MIERGLIERLPGPGRAVRHQLTAKGRSLRRAGEKIVDRELTVSFAALTPKQLALFDKLLLRVLGASEEAEVDE